MKIKQSTRYILATILILIMIIIISSLILKYNVKPALLFYSDKNNLIHDGSFEEFNRTAGDCCNADSSKSKVFASKSTNAFDGKFSLNLTSEGQCSCILNDIQRINKNLKYLISFYYKGDKPATCFWVTGDNLCAIDKKFENSTNWKKYNFLFSPTNKSESASVYFYASSNGEETITNLYDDLQVHQLIQMDTSYDFKPNEQYLVLTDLSNVVRNGQPLNEEGYYLVTGKPEITLKFPLTELILLLFMMLVVIRLLFKKQIVGTEKTIVRDVKRI